jgi:hypothetical protein
MDVACRLPKDKGTIAINHEINRALYHTGRLPYEMFSFPQNPQALLLTRQPRPSNLTQLQLCDLFIELGSLNTAEKMAAELLASEGPTGVVLEKLARINVVKDQPQTARVYLNALQKDPIYGARAAAMLQGLDTYYEEALLIWRTMKHQPIDPVALGGSPETFKRYQAFLEAGRALQTGDRQAGMARLVRDFGTSYFFYYGFGRVGFLASAEQG